MTTRASNGTFAKGTSGNPLGRPKMPEALQARIRNLSDKAVSALEEGLSSKDERIKLESAKAILDRGHGKPATSGELKIEAIGTEDAHLAALRKIMSRRQVATAGEQADEPTEIGPAQGSC